MNEFASRVQALQATRRPDVLTKPEAEGEEQKMLWSAFLGGLLGAVVGLLLFAGVIWIWDELDRRRQLNKQEEATPDKSNSKYERVLEIDIEEKLIANFSSYFPTLRIYQSDSPSRAGKPTGVRLRTPAGEIDILCVDEGGNLVVIELKRGKASDVVVTQLTRYLN